LAIFIRVVRVCADRQYVANDSVTFSLTQNRTNGGNPRKVISSSLSTFGKGGTRL
jgi:hypothetical protein